MKNLSRHQWIAIICLALSILWILFGPWLLISFSIVDLTGTGQIGDTIGGITAPIIGLTSAVLIYLSFAAQIRANEIVQNEALKTNIISQQQTNFNYIVDEFERVKTKFDSIEHYPDGNDVELVTGYHALKGFTQKIDKHFAEKSSNWRLWIGGTGLTKVDYIIQAYALFLTEIKNIDLSEHQRKIIQSKVWLHFAENIYESFQILSIMDTGNPGKEDKKFVHQAHELKYRVLDILSRLKEFENSFTTT